MTAFDSMNFGKRSSIVRDTPPFCLLKMAKVEYKTAPDYFKGRACSRLRATQNLKGGFTCTPAKLPIHRPYLIQAATSFHERLDKLTWSISGAGRAVRPGIKLGL